MATTDRGRRARRSPLTWGLAAGLLAARVATAGVPELRDIPGELPDDRRDTLAERRGELQDDLAELQAVAAEFNTRCASVPSGSRAARKCRKDERRLQSQKRDYVRDADRFNDSVDREVRREISRLEDLIEDQQDMIERDQQAIRNLGLDTRAGEIEEWAAMSESARYEFRKKALDAILSAGIARAQQSVQATAPPPLSRERARELLDRIGTLKPGSAERAQAVKVLTGPAHAEANLTLLSTLKRHKDALLRGGVVPSERQRGLEAIAMLLEWQLHDPRFKLLIADLKFAVFAVHDNATRRVSRARIEQLTEMTEDQLRALGKLTALLERHVAELNESQRALEALSQAS